MRARHLMAYALLAGLLLTPLAAGADSHEKAPKPLTWISYVQSKPGQSMATVQHIAKNGAKIYDGMMAAGDVLHWGVAMPINHRPGDGWNVMEWVTFRDWAAADTFMQHFMKMQMTMDPAEAKANQEEWMSLVEPGSHHDALWRHQVFKVDPEAGPPAYFGLGYHTAGAGKGEALTGMLKKYATPVMDGLLGKGAIHSWGVGTQELHGDPGGTHVFWYGMGNLAALDAISGAFEAMTKKRGEEAQKEAMAEFLSAADFGAHHDRVLMVVHNGGGGSGEDAADEAGAGEEGGADE